MELRKVVLLNISVLLMGIINASPIKADIISQSAENFRSIAFDGFWGEKSTNQAIYYEGNYKRTYTYWIDSFGDLVVGTIDNVTNEIETKVVCDNAKLKYNEMILSMLFSPDGKMLLFVLDANQPQQLTLFTMNTAEDIRVWNKRVIVFQVNNSKINYAKALNLSNDADRMYFFTQSKDNDINYITSSDSGTSWSKPEIIVNTKAKSEPFFISTDSKSKIAFVLNTESDNKILLYNSDNANNSTLKLSEIPVNQNIIVSDAAFDTKGQLITTSIEKTATKSENYFYNLYQKGKWLSAKLPVTNLNGGLLIDKESTTVVYYSAKVDTVCELRKLTLSGSFNSKWKVDQITKSSPYINFNVFPVLNANESNKLQLLWQSDIANDIKTNRIYTIKANLEIPELTNTTDSANIILLMKRVAEWQLAHPFTEKQKYDWHWGAFYTGLIAAYNSTGDDRFLNELLNVGQFYNWGFRDDIFHADRLLAADIYEFLYDKYQQPEMIEKAKWIFDVHLARVAQPDLSHFDDANYKQEWWSWCDALYMAPPSIYHLANITNNEKYRDYAFKQWKITADYLYSKSDSLFYRDNRYFDAKSTNGKKVFWSRGNGWVIGALARILNYLPKDHSQREYYVKMYKEIAAKLLRLQMENGMWTVNLLDPQELYLGESSGTGFFGYALAWGVNNNILDKKTYSESVRKAWKALSANVNRAGKLGYVQQVAGSPFPFFEDQSHVYASGAFLMFGAEMLKLQ